MCGLFGYINTNNSKVGDLADDLAVVSAVRGEDATGVAFLQGKELKVQKAALAAYEFIMPKYKGMKVLMGHTRMTTSGAAKYNKNNHPFMGKCKNGKRFALAHNGYLWGVENTRIRLGLPDTAIETDSYLAVQLLETQDEISFKSLKYMAENIYGVFTITVLDHKNNLWVVRQDNPFSIMELDGVLIYASTDEILLKALLDSVFKDRILDSFKGQEAPKILTPERGEIWCISPTGNITKDKFKSYSYSSNYSYAQDYYYYSDYYTKPIDEDSTDGMALYTSMLYSEAGRQGVTKEDINLLLDWGYSGIEVEDAIFNYTIRDLVDDFYKYVLGWDEDEDKEDVEDVAKNG